MNGATESLRAAMARLLEGRPRFTDGALTKKNLYLEAQVSRATMNRSTDVMQEWDLAVSAALDENPEAKKPLTEEVRLRRELRNANKVIRELRATIDGAASIIAVLSEENRYLQEREKNSPSATLTDIREFKAREAD